MPSNQVFDTEEELIVSLKRAEEKAYVEVMRLYKEQIAKTVFGMLGNGAEAEDIGQEVFIRLFKSIYKFKGEAKLATYITRIAINLSLNAIQRRKRKWQIFYSGEKKDERLNAFADSRTEKQKDEKELVRRAVSLLDSNYREVVVLKVFQGYKSKEVAEILQIPLGTVLTRYARAQKKLKILISELDSDYDR